MPRTPGVPNPGGQRVSSGLLCQVFPTRMWASTHGQTHDKHSCVPGLKLRAPGCGGTQMGRPPSRRPAGALVKGLPGILGVAPQGLGEGWPSTAGTPGGGGDRLHPPRETSVLKGDAARLPSESEARQLFPLLLQSRENFLNRLSWWTHRTGPWFQQHKGHCRSGLPRPRAGSADPLKPSLLA